MLHLSLSHNFSDGKCSFSWLHSKQLPAAFCPFSCPDWPFGGGLQWPAENLVNVQLIC